MMTATPACHGVDVIHIIIHAFISSLLDYCNSLLAGVSGQLLHRLPVIQNATARLVTGATKYDRMTPVLRSLHWLSVQQRIVFKTAVIVYKCLNGLAPPYPTVIRLGRHSPHVSIFNSLCYFLKREQVHQILQRNRAMG